MNMTANQLRNPIAKTGMLIRRPVVEVFDAFVDPEITTKFWFTKSTGKLKAGTQVEWTWEMYDHSVSVMVKEIEPNKRIVVEWGNYKSRTTVEWTFKPFGENQTFVEITNSGFQGSPDELLAQVSDSTGGFSLVLAGLKAFLEHDIQLNLVRDRFPEGK